MIELRRGAGAKKLTVALSMAALIASALAQPPRKQAPGGPIPVPPGVAAHRNVAYVSTGHPRQVLDLFVPENSQKSLPLIIWIHGGGWAGGNKEGCPPLRQGFAARGYAIASLNYRLSGDATFPAQIEDCKAAIRWLRAHATKYNLDPERFAAWGSSAGGHLVALLGTSGGVKEFDVGPHADLSSRVQCVLDDYGPTDLRQMDAHRLPTAPFLHDSPDSPESKFIGGPIQDPAHHAKVARANPITYVTADDPPFLIAHGDQDPLVPHHQSELLFAALKKAGVRVRLNTVKGGGHGQGFGGAELLKMRTDFLELHLQRKQNDAVRWPVAMVSSTEAVALPPGAPVRSKKKQ